ncbi:hypothetical protein SLS55_005595 [Diplodia seriata]|uniref:Uncharacterized protein n=1 Tax=Diplodia seriata TaxID=420778 RepID=A0ABR3CGT9_9PEZI
MPGTASLSHACNVPREADVSRGRSETLRPDARREDPSPTDPLVPSIESPHSQEENAATAETLLDQFRSRTNCSMRPINDDPFVEGVAKARKQKRRKDYEDDSSDDARRMPPPPPPKSARMTSPRNCSTNGPPNEDLQARSSGEVSPTYQSMIQERTGSYPVQHSPSPTSTGRPRTLARMTISTSGTPGIVNNNKAAQDRYSSSPSKESSPDHLPDQRRDSPLQQRSPSEATAFHQSEEQLWGESSAGGAASAVSFTEATCENPPPLAIRTSPAMTPATTPGASPVMNGGFKFDVNRVLFKLVMLEGPNSNCEYAMRLHGCHTAQALFQAVDDRLEDALGPGEVVKKLVCHTNTFVPQRCRGAIDLPRKKNSTEASFSNLLGRLKATVNGAEGDDDIEVVAEVVEVMRRW